MSYKPVDTAITMVVGPCIDDTDFKSLEEAIAHNAAGMDVSLIVEKTDGTTAVTAITLTTGGTSDWTHKDGGYYEIEVTAAQNIEEGVGYIRGVCTGILPFESAHYNIVKANVYDSWVKGTDVLQADITQLGGAAQSLTDLKDFADAGYDPGTNKITGCKVNDDMVGTNGANTTTPPTVTAIRQEMDTNSVDFNSILEDLVDIKGTNFAKDTHSLKNILDDVTGLNGSAMIGTNGANTTVPDAAGVAPTAAEIKSEVAAALTDIKLDHLINIAVDTNWATTVHLDSVIGHLADVGTAATFNRTTDALEALRVRGDAAWATATGFSTHNAAAVKTAIEAGGSSIATILADTGELQTDWVNGGRLDLILDIIAADTTTDIPGLIATAQADLDAITGADGVTLATLQGLYAPNVVVPDVAGTAAGLHTTTDALVTRILGLDQENFYIDNTVFSSGNMTSCRVRIYSVAGSVGSASDVIATYTMTAGYSGDEMSTYSMVKV